MAKTKDAKNLFAEKVAARKKLNEGRVIGFDDVEFEDGVRDTYGVGDYDDEEDEEFLASYGLSSFNDDEIEDAIRGEEFDDDEAYDAAFDDDDISDDELQAEEDRYFESLTKREKKLREALDVILAKKAALRESDLGYTLVDKDNESVFLTKEGRVAGSPQYFEKKEAERIANAINSATKEKLAKDKDSTARYAKVIHCSDKS